MLTLFLPSIITVLPFAAPGIHLTTALDGRGERLSDNTERLSPEELSRLGPGELAERRHILEGTSTSIGVPVFLVVLGAVLAPLGTIATGAGLFLIAASSYALAAELTIMLGGVLALVASFVAAGGVACIAIGASLIKQRGMRREAVEAELEQIQQRLDQLPPPASEYGGPAPTLVLTTF